MQSLLFLSMLVLALFSEADQSPVADLDLDQDLEQDLDMELTRHRLLQRARTAGLLSQRVVKDLILAQMSLPEDNALPEESAGHMNLQRSVENLPPRERKAGCKNFYWKGFTSC
ncbi:hypothetical protein NQD34_009707 [Periophthalmus magnuspinnatus]|uniref:somatostatin-2-like n=1 Tax=Periophthalmus magnuspinnatus TaxID=409849 RepID=UPI00145B47B8|nr:somatostatin-2-like [Periophthalmus magnuspinnatus]KAJ0022217.1 hypothetical protein NQD34_009707 [Periophthalmus magnuspinnatus]